MALIYEIQNGLVRLPKGQTPPGGLPVVEVLCHTEFQKLEGLVGEETRENIASLLKEETCFVNEYPNCIIGSIAVPNKTHAMGDRWLFSFYWSNQLLAFVDESNIAAQTLQRVIDAKVPVNSLAECLQEFLHELLSEDVSWLTNLEDQIEDAEDAMLSSSNGIAWSKIAEFRRLTVRMTSYYEQFSSMAESLSNNENGMMTEQESHGFKRIVAMADRLSHRAETIREYSLVLRELHQTQIDSKQSSTIQLLTVVTIIFAPMELITGWFGMSLSYLPGKDEFWGFPFVCISIALLTIVLIIWFHKKKWI